jgi:hypothetical protein
MVRRRVDYNSAVHTRRIIVMHIACIGIDLGKTTFHLVALGERSKVLVREKFSRTQLLAYTAICLPHSSVLRRVPEPTFWGRHYGNKVTKCGSSRRSS